MQASKNKQNCWEWWSKFIRPVQVQIYFEALALNGSHKKDMANLDVTSKIWLGIGYLFDGWRFVKVFDLVLK